MQENGTGFLAADFFDANRDGSLSKGLSQSLYIALANIQAWPQVKHLSPPNKRGDYPLTRFAVTKPVEKNLQSRLRISHKPLGAPQSGVYLSPDAPCAGLPVGLLFHNARQHHMGKRRAASVRIVKAESYTRAKSYGAQQSVSVIAKEGFSKSC
jgi:hypothetical protein